MTDRLDPSDKAHHHLHRLASERVDDLRANKRGLVRKHENTDAGCTRVTHLLGVEVLRAVGVLLEQLTAAVPEKLVVRDLDLERLRVPLVVELRVVGVDEGQFLVCVPVSVPTSGM